jgi:hypothetical protein
MADTDPLTTQATHGETSDDQPSQVTVLAQWILLPFMYFFFLRGFFVTN